MTEVAPVENAAVNATDMREEVAAGFYNPDLDFLKLAKETKLFTKGFRLVEKSTLLGVPFIIVSVTYREGFPRPDGKPGDYVSIEAVVADKHTLESPPVRSMRDGELLVYPNEPIIFNDSSTGVRRTITALLHAMEIIDPGKPGNKDENIYDRPYQIWRSGADRATTGVIADQNGEQFRYGVSRGLRKSEYEWQPPTGKPQPATTYYLS